MKRFVGLFLLLFVLLGFNGVASAAQFAGGDTYSLTSELNDDFYVGAQKLTISAPVLGELFAAGNTVDISKRPGRSIMAAGETVTISDGSNYNVYAAGNSVTIKGVIEHDAYVGGNSVTIDPSTEIKGSLRIAGNSLSINGKVAGDVYFSGTSVTSNAVIGGNLRGDATSVKFSGGSVGKDFIYKSNKDAEGLDKVNIAGKKERSELNKNQTTVNAKRKALLYSILSMIIMGAAFVLLTPHKITAVHDMVTQSWGSKLLTGLLTLVVTPIAALILMVTTIGLPLGLIMLVLWGIAIYMATITAQMIFGKQLLDRLHIKQNNWWLALIVGVLVTQLLFIIPVAGGILGSLFFIGLVLPTLGAAYEWWKDRLAHRNT